VNHPTDEELSALSLGRLGEAELAVVAAHISDCPDCCRRVEELSGADPLQARLRQSGARRGALVPPAQRRSAVRALRHGRETGSSGRRDSGPATLPMPREVGDYEILAEVGRGGMGVVYQARHRGLHRVVALKMVLAGEFMSPAQETRFRLEAELAARVQHPNIVQVYEIGTHDGRPFLALEWVEGGNLASRLDGKPWPPGEAAALVETLARAIHVAHGEGVVHRDLKPANILLSWVRGQESGVSKDSLLTPDSCPLTPKVADFGLAQPTEGGQTLTYSGFLVGTPGYMAPEQAGGKRALIGPATDIYALGVVLYQLVTGQLPFRGDSTLEVLRAVVSDEPIRPRRLQPRLPRDLEAITLHCLEKEPGRRYPTALALAEDLERFRAGAQVVARPVGAAARLARAARRRPVVALLLALLAVSIFGGLAGVTWKWLEADAEKREAVYQSYRARIAAAAAVIQNHDVADAARQLDGAPEEWRGWEWHHLRSRLDDSSAVIPVPLGGAGFLLAAPDRLRVGVLTPNGLRLTDLDGVESGMVPIGVAIDPERRYSVSATQTRHGVRVAVWVGDTAFDLLDEAGRVLCRVKVPAKGPGPVVVSPDGTRLACYWMDGTWARLGVFDATTGKQTVVCEGHPLGLWTCTFSPDGTRLVSGGEDRTARLWDPATGALLATFHGHASKVIGTAFSRDGGRLVTSSSDGTVRQWDVATGREIEPPYDRHTGEIAAVAYSPDGQWVVSAGTDRTIRVWRASGRQDVAIRHGHTSGVSGVAFAPGGRQLASVSCASQIVVGDDTVRVWDVDPDSTLPVLRGHRRSVHPVSFSPDGRWIASGSWDTKVRLWDAATGEQPCAPLEHTAIVRDLAYAPDGSWLVTATDADDRLRIWDVATARIRKDIPVAAGTQLRSVTVSPDGKRVAATAIDVLANTHRLYVCDVATGDRLFSAEGWSRGYSPDGRWLAVTSADAKTVLLLDARTHETVAPIRGHKNFVYKVAFSPDGRYLASCSEDQTVRLWPIDGGASRELRGHTTQVFAVAFHPDGTRLATAGGDGVVWLWDVARGEEVARLPGHTSFVWSLAFSPDGTTLVSASGDTTVRLWDTAPLKTRYQARREAAALRPEAERLVEQLWQKNAPEEVVEALRADRALGEALRQAALREVLRRSLPPEAAPR
jgi:eukaryotic-like serine/threonine-protein kinase